MKVRARATRNATNDGWTLEIHADGVRRADRVVTDAEVKALKADDWRQRGAETGAALTKMLVDDGAEPAIVELQAAVDDPFLVLPWELMTDNAGAFLAKKGLGVLRLVKEEEACCPAIQAPARVLIVVGAQPNDPAIKPGAEYLGLLRTVQGVRTRLVLGATETALQSHVKDFVPDVVHFICHGGRVLRGEQGHSFFLELVDEAIPSTRKRLFADQLTGAITRSDGTLPPVVVLNACETGGGAGDFALGTSRGPSLAAQLVDAGVHVAVGHAGEANDQACRLFTRRFYKSLADGIDVVEDLGRIRMELLRNVSSLEWATVRIFARAIKAAPGAPPGSPCVLRAKGSDIATQWRTGVLTLEDREDNDPVFCARSDLLGHFDVLLSGKEAQIASVQKIRRFLILHPSPSQAFPPGSTGESGGRKFGLTFTLQELRRRAAHDGHLAVRLKEKVLRDLNVDKKNPFTAIVDHILAQIESAAVDFGLKQDGVHWKRSAPPPSGFAKYFADNLGTLVKALERASIHRAPLVVLLVDNLHQTGPGVLDDLLALMLDIDVRQVDALRLIGTFKPPPTADTLSNTLKEWYEDGARALTHVYTLEDFGEEVERDLAHLQFLLSFPAGNKRLTLVPTERSGILNAFRRRSWGPHELRPTGKAWDLVEVFRDAGTLKEVDDEVRLLEMAKLANVGGGP